MIKININKIVPNPNNPRLIKDHKFHSLVKSIKEFPEMLEIRPIVINADYVILGGNMRWKASIEAGIREVPVIVADKLSEEQQREFIIKDNANFGEWDYDILANEWDSEKLEEWGVNILNFENTELDYSGKNEEINIDDLCGVMTIKLNFSETDYWRVKQQLSEIAATHEQAIWKLLGNEI